LLGIVSTLVTAVLIDATGRHMPWGLAACGLQVISCILLLVWNLPIDAKLAAYCESKAVLHHENADLLDIAGTAYMIQPVCFTWANKTLAKTGDDAMRALTLYSMNSASSVLFA
jgi:ACS family pantothenate transporter-like MFS transporter